MGNFIRYLFLLLIIVCSTSTLYAQSVVNRDDSDDYIENRDSTWGFDFDFSDLDFRKVKLDILEAKLAKIRAYNDSMMLVIKAKNIAQRSDSLEQLYDLLNGDISTSYNAYSLFFGQYHSNLGSLNKGLNVSNFPQLENTSYHFTNFFDFTWKRKRCLNELYMIYGIVKDVTMGNVSVSYNYWSPLNYTFGFAVIDSKRLQIFPFAGLSYQSSNIKFSNSFEQLFELGSASYDSLLSASNINRRGVDYQLKKRELVLNYGLEMDFHLIYSKRKTGVILGVRAGKLQPLLSGGWIFEGKRYSQLSDVTIRDYYIDAVIRIYTRRNGNRGKYNLRNNWWDDNY